MEHLDIEDRDFVIRVRPTTSTAAWWWWLGGAGGRQACSEGGACVPRHTKSERRAAWRSTKTSFESRYSGRATTCTREIHGDIGEI